jgi:hypothetical protein
MLGEMPGSNAVLKDMPKKVHDVSWDVTMETQTGEEYMKVDMVDLMSHENIAKYGSV